MQKLIISLLISILIAPSYLNATVEPELKARANGLYRQLRCMVCAGQTIAESDTELAQDMRALVLEKMASGQNDEAILEYFAERYGEDVLLKPPMRSDTLILWLSPLIFLCIGGIIYMVTIRQSKH